MALNIQEVAELRERIAKALLSDRISGFERQFLTMHQARLGQHGTHAMMTSDQRGRIDRILEEARVDAPPQPLLDGDRETGPLG